MAAVAPHLVHGQIGGRFYQWRKGHLHSQNVGFFAQPCHGAHLFHPHQGEWFRPAPGSDGSGAGDTVACQTAEMKVEVASPPVHRRTSWVGFPRCSRPSPLAVLLIPCPALGLRVLALVVIYNVALPVFARRTDDDVR